MQDRLTKTKERYGFATWSKRASSAPSVVVMNFVPWAEDCLNWQRSFRDDVAAPENARFNRTVWDDPNDSDVRILIDVYETPTRDMALECLARELSRYTLAGLSQGPGDLGDVCFVHPEGERPAVFFARGNLSLRISNVGRRAVDVIDWARRLDARILDRPGIERAIVEMTPEKEHAPVNQPVGVDVSLRWRLGANGYYKFFSAAGELSLRNGRLYFAPTGPGARIEAYAVESEREPYGGRLIIELEQP